MTIHIGTTSMQIMSVLDGGPCYAAKMIEDHPDIAATGVKNGVMIVDPSGLYVRLGRLEKRGLIERIKNYKPQRTAKHQLQSRRTRVWYRLTPKGLEVLQEHRRLIGK